MLLIGCATDTKFKGDAKIDDGPKGCEKICSGWDMELVGMVALGEYTDGCICKKKDASLSLSDVSQVLMSSAVSPGGTEMFHDHGTSGGGGSSINFLLR